MTTPVGPQAQPRAGPSLPGNGRWAVPRPPVRQACVQAAAALLAERGMRALGDIHAVIEEALANGTAPPAAGPAEQIRDLLYACVHPTLPVDRQLSMLLRFAFWLPGDSAARVLQIDPSTVGIHLRQGCRRLRAVARRGRQSWSANNEAHSLSVLRLLDRLRRRGLELTHLSPRVAEALGHDTPVLAEVLLSTDARVARGEAHAFLAELYLGDERARRCGPADDPAHPLRVRAEPAEDAMAKGLRHLRAAQELGARDRFVWLARIHAAYLLSPDRAHIDWEQMVGLYEGLLRASATDGFDRTDVGSSAA